MPPDHVIVAGGAGFVGSHAAKALSESGRIPVVLDNLSAGHAHAVRFGPLEPCDIRDTAGLVRIFRTYQPTAVMHFAASIEVGIGERASLSFYENNVAGTISLLKAMQEAEVAKIIFSSTCAVYGNAAPPLTEVLSRQPASVYARTKAMAEDIIADCVRAHGMRAVVLRYFNACGADASGLLGEEHDPETHLIPNVLKAAAGLGGMLKVFGIDYPTPDGTCLRDYVHVTDLARAHVSALDLLDKENGFHVFNLGTGKPYSVLEVIDAVARVTKTRPPYETCPRREGDVPILTADITKAQEVLAYAPRHSDLDSIVQSAWAFHRQKWGV
jgi:UDP-glucose-4-epimerase GalE